MRNSDTNSAHQEATEFEQLLVDIIERYRAVLEELAEL